ncbi:hypothetical protein TREES_T100006628 [Tupaia chinensis]|uniref:Uncharacterized protein n=1 Tax=Tupaia chinensis TaxID=246437 RepID=L9KTM6_TUPCH|nr:hypothetical protein TREES_T100006628 [Tupaia chinensis]
MWTSFPGQASAPGLASPPSAPADAVVAAPVCTLVLPAIPSCSLRSGHTECQPSPACCVTASKFGTRSRRRSRRSAKPGGPRKPAHERGRADEWAGVSGAERGRLEPELAGLAVDALAGLRPAQHHALPHNAKGDGDGQNARTSSWRRWSGSWTTGWKKRVGKMPGKTPVRPGARAHGCGLVLHHHLLHLVDPQRASPGCQLGLEPVATARAGLAVGPGPSNSAISENV